MSEENSYGAVATQAPPVAETEPAAGRSSKALLIALGVAVAVLGVFAYLLFGRGGSAPDEGGTVPKPPAASEAGTPVEDGEPVEAPVATKPENTNVQGRNPFVPLVVEPVEDSNDGTGSGDPATDPGTDPVTDPGTVPTTPTTPTTPTGDTVTVKLVSVKGDLVATKVGNVNYTGLSAGDTFGTNFQVYAIFNDSCAGFLYGDDSFALCEGKSVTLAKS